MKRRNRKNKCRGRGRGPRYAKSEIVIRKCGAWDSGCPCTKCTADRLSCKVCNAPADKRVVKMSRTRAARDQTDPPFVALLKLFDKPAG